MLLKQAPRTLNGISVGDWIVINDKSNASFGLFFRVMSVDRDDVFASSESGYQAYRFEYGQFSKTESRTPSYTDTGHKKKKFH